MKQEKYNWRQIKQVIKDAYQIEADKDERGVKIFYEEELLSVLLERLKEIKQFIK
jgi:hypothetical protein